MFYVYLSLKTLVSSRKSNNPEPAVHTSQSSRNIYKSLTVFRESNTSDGSLMSREVSDVDPLFQIPDFDHRVLCPSTKDKTVRMELGTGQCWKT